MGIEGKIENWKDLHKLALRTELAAGTIKIDGKEYKFSVTINCDNKAIFVELGDYKSTYLLSDMVEDALPGLVAHVQTEKEKK